MTSSHNFYTIYQIATSLSISLALNKNMHFNLIQA